MNIAVVIKIAGQFFRQRQYSRQRKTHLGTPQTPISGLEPGHHAVTMLAREQASRQRDEGTPQRHAICKKRKSPAPGAALPPAALRGHCAFGARLEKQQVEKALDGRYTTVPPTHP
jgi:hypothetical protein